MTTTITVHGSVQGLHQWVDAPDRRAYLRDLHRHTFMFEVTANVGHHDRDIEFHDLAELSAHLLHGFGDEYHPESTLVTFGGESCEALAARLARELQREGVDVAEVGVGEDGENMSRVVVRSATP